MSAFVAVLKRELQLAARSKTDWLMPPLFLVMVVTLFALGSRPGDPALAAFAPAVLWVGALLAALLTLERLFRSDFEDGTLEQYCLSPAPLVLIAAAKLLAHWLLTGLPLVLLAVPLAVALKVEPVSILAASLALGTPVLSLLGGFVSALTVGLPRAGALLPILVLPLIAPVIIFGAGAVRAAQSGLPAAAPLYFLACILVLSLTLVPWATAAVLKNTFD